MAEDTKTARRVFNKTEAEKASELGISASFLQKDRLKPNPQVPFRRYGRAIRYATED